MNRKPLNVPGISVLLSFLLAGLSISSLLFSSCRDKKPLVTKEIVEMPEKMDEKVKGLIKKSLNYAAAENGRLNDSLLLYQWPALAVVYKEKSFVPLWSSMQHWLPQADSLFDCLDELKYYGLYPQDYHAPVLKKIKSRLDADSLLLGDRKDAVLWAHADMLLSDALVNIMHDVKFGRLPEDSITLRKDSALTELFVTGKFNAITSGLSLHYLISSLEPKHKEYHELKAGLKNFLDSADFSETTRVAFPAVDSAEFKTTLIRRLFELGFVDSAGAAPDSSRLAAILKKFQKSNRLTVDGKIGWQTIRALNLSDREKFKRIAITLDRYKMLPENMPEKFVWVNIPSYTLKLIKNDTIVISSRIVVGKPKTRTPVLTSAVSELITYPQWNIPQSIIVKEILPALKKDPGYLARKGFGLFDNKGEEVDPYSVDWSKYKRGVPYRIIQGSGDDNALGVLKFNFPNKYAVYLHDTNQRFYFGLDTRALSHGCVRVQQWEKLALFIMNNEIETANGNIKTKSKPVPVDSLRHWLQVKEKHSIPVRNRIPLFIRYFTCEADNGRIIFFEDIYDEDKQLAEQLFASKKPEE